MKCIIYVALFVSGMFFFSCNSSELEPTDYVSWIENKDNGLLVEQQKGAFTYKAQYKPTDYIVLKSLKQNQIADTTLRRERESYGDLIYYNFQISAKEAGFQDLLKAETQDNAEFGARLNYYSFQMQQDLKLIQGEDTLPCVLFHMERTYGIVPYLSFVLGFDQELQSSKKENQKLVFTDNAFGMGAIELEISAKAIQNIPTLISL